MTAAAGRPPRHRHGRRRSCPSVRGGGQPPSPTAAGERRSCQSFGRRGSAWLATCRVVVSVSGCVACSGRRGTPKKGLI